MAFERHLSGDQPAAQRILQDFADAAARNPERKARLIYITLIGEVAAAAEDWAAARQALSTIEASTDTPQWSRLKIQRATLRAELALHGDDAAEALSLLRPLVDEAMDADSYGANARLRATLARAELRGGTAAAAWDAVGAAVHQAMEAGEPLGLLLCGPAALDELAQAPWPATANASALAYLRECAARARQLRASAAQAAPSPPPSDNLLSERELQVLERVAQGQSNKLIGRALGLSPHTVKRHMARIFDKTGQSSRGQVAAWFVRRSGRGMPSSGGAT
jgi:LuxR family maltose regulon positive regulatory protein